jgi:RimJ/RimL family protein N-acetyltransferase
MTNIRKAKQSDKRWFLKTYNPKENRYWLEDNQILRKEWYKSLITRVSSLWFIIYNEEGERVGLFNTFFKGNKYLFGIIISKQHRRKGYARDTIKDFLKITDKNKMDVYLECFSDNPAMKLYKKLGFQQTNTFKTVRGRKFVEMKRKSCE